MKTGRVFNEITKAVAGGASIVVNKGGTRSGKTFATLQFLIWYAQTFENMVISVVGETIPFLKRGCIRDFETMLDTAYNRAQWNATDLIYKLSNGSQIEFFSADNESKIHGSARDVLFINECFFINFEVYRQLSMRTRKLVLLDYNPRARFWVDERIMGRESVRLIHSTYLDNPFLSARQVAEIEAYKSDANFWRVYGLGETGSVEGLIYTNWSQCAELPAEFEREFYCVDFGFTIDPTAILQVRTAHGILYVHEIAYLPNMTNPMIAEALKQAGAGLGSTIICDSAEPKSIAEINTHGLNAKPAIKGAGSIMAGINQVQGYEMRVTTPSVGVINELRNYMYKRDKNGEYIAEPIDKFNHALDALRYGCNSVLWAKPLLKAPRARRVRVGYN